MVFGVGASGHNTGAPTCTGTYPAWLLHAAGQSMRLLQQGLRRTVGDHDHRRPDRDIGIALGLVMDWWSAAWQMLRMRRASRRRLLGGNLATRRKHAMRG
ncbi:hypothetical protein BDD21_0079 [Thiocapsa rosea]|uniref:Uncharacterized protein n=2 Tax=Thiocapsa rosea TaxID=69360 RepID=A0A495V062_9GAMM|nr:hypothetical protein BDD21_0079 [Thiocapsa rosea]